MARKNRTAEKREQIVWALHDLLIERGHETITIKDIASRAGMPHGVIHYYFQSKAEIYSNLVEAIQEKYDRLWAERQNRIGDEPPGERRARGLEFMVDELILSPTFGRVFYNLLHMGFEHENIRKALTRMYRHYHEELTRVFHAEGAGERSPALAYILQALVGGVTILKWIDPDSVDRDHAIRLLRRAVDGMSPKVAEKGRP
jgi:AcrR family transcriptional regulator